MSQMWAHLPPVIPRPGKAELSRRSFAIPLTCTAGRVVQDSQTSISWEFAKILKPCPDLNGCLWFYKTQGQTPCKSAEQDTSQGIPGTFCPRRASGSVLWPSGPGP